MAEMTIEEYKATGCCPVCRKLYVAEGMFVPTGTHGEMKVTCRACDTKWIEQWELVGFKLNEVHDDDND